VVSRSLHCRRHRTQIKKIKSSVSAGSELTELRLDTEGAVDEVRKHDAGNSAAAQKLGEASVIAVLVEEGVPTAKAAEIAARAAIAVRGEA
jgi:hypothetical protein